MIAAVAMVQGLIAAAELLLPWRRHHLLWLLVGSMPIARLAQIQI